MLPSINNNMRSYEIISELADKPEKFSAVTSDDDVWEIVAPSLNLYLYLSRGIGPSGENNQVYIEFAVNGRYDLTKGGNAIKVLSTVIAMIRTYLPKFVKRQDQYISFGANKSEPSRVSLYTRAVPIISGLLRTMDYSWEFSPSDQDTSSSLAAFNWSRE
jgi:hypothetical protein